ncbi:MAG: transposase [Gammaproteobacteria bacterium]|nr:transposase [Gammaproteobacteria bacterium]MYF38618.1 transposase [Gammaproteobacteria bacterium]
MGSVGECYDNAIAESFFTTLRTGAILRQPRRYFPSLATARARMFELREGFHNSYPRHLSLG